MQSFGIWLWENQSKGEDFQRVSEIVKEVGSKWQCAV
jgi:hypothetical protein